MCAFPYRLVSSVPPRQPRTSTMVRGSGVYVCRIIKKRPSGATS